MTILLLEDEVLIARGLQILLQELEPGAHIAGPLASVRECREWFASHPAPDLILADIQLSDGISFQALEQIPAGIPVIFTTAFDEYALRAFKINSIDYLLKPIDRKELQRALSKFHQLQDKFSNAEFRDQLLDVLQGRITKPAWKTRFLAYSGKSLVPVQASDAAWFQKEEIIFLNTTDQRQLVTEYRSLDEIQELCDPSKFYRANRQFLIQGDCVEKFETDEVGKISITMKGPEKLKIMVSKDKAADFRKWMEQR